MLPTILKLRRLVNCTPYLIHLAARTATGEVKKIEIPPSGTTAECETVREAACEIEIEDALVPVYATGFSALAGLPAPEEGTVYITSPVVARAAALQGRDDVVIIGDAVWDEVNHVVEAESLARV